MGRSGRRTVGDNRERLAKIKRAAVDRVLEKLSTDPEKAGLVMTRDELLDRLSELYAQGLRHAKALDPNKARYVRESMVECAKARLEKDGWRVVDPVPSPTASRSSTLSHKMSAAHSCSYSPRSEDRCRGKGFGQCDESAVDSFSPRTNVRGQVCSSSCEARLGELEEMVTTGKMTIVSLIRRVELL